MQQHRAGLSPISLLVMSITIITGLCMHANPLKSGQICAENVIDILSQQVAGGGSVLEFQVPRLLSFAHAHKAGPLSAKIKNSTYEPRGKQALCSARVA